MEEKGIIRICGTVQEVNFYEFFGKQYVNIMLEYKEVYGKLLNEPEYRLVKNENEKKCMELSYQGQVELSSDQVEKIEFPENCDVDVLGYGTAMNNIHLGNKITAYILYHMVERDGVRKSVSDKTIVFNHSLLPETMRHFIERVSKAIHP